jgi:hypothetical protein
MAHLTIAEDAAIAVSSWFSVKKLGVTASIRSLGRRLNRRNLVGWLERFQPFAVSVPIAAFAAVREQIGTDEPTATLATHRLNLPVGVLGVEGRERI